MGLSEEGEENVMARFEELCLDLNMDKKAKEEAWKSYEKIRTNYTLEVSVFRQQPPYLLFRFITSANTIRFSL